jgi:hypothetical protein
MSGNDDDEGTGAQMPRDTVGCDADARLPLSSPDADVDTRPTVEALVGADMPFEPLPTPDTGRRWDPVKGRWVRNGIAIPPDPGMATMPPQSMDSDPDFDPAGAAPHEEQAPDWNESFASPAPAEPDDIDTPVPWWGLLIVAAMFGIGLALGLLFTLY